MPRGRPKGSKNKTTTKEVVEEKKPKAEIKTEERLTPLIGSNMKKPDQRKLKYTRKRVRPILEAVTALMKKMASKEKSKSFRKTPIHSIRIRLQDIDVSEKIRKNAKQKDNVKIDITIEGKQVTDILRWDVSVNSKIPNEYINKAKHTEKEKEKSE